MGWLPSFAAISFCRRMFIDSQMGKKGDLSKSSQEIDGDDAALFREAMQDVKPLAETGKVDYAQPKPKPIPRPATPSSHITEDKLSDNYFLEMAEGDEWSFARPGLKRHDLRKLRRGHWHIQDELDLHGLTREIARRRLVLFLDNSVQQGYRCVRIIHGRGLSSKDRQPVLKILIGNWLTQRAEVLAFCQARREHGGGGAVLVLLKNLVNNTG
jgi:DNA-nicking Smr family endonuclease